MMNEAQVGTFRGLQLSQPGLHLNWYTAEL